MTRLKHDQFSENSICFEVIFPRTTFVGIGPSCKNSRDDFFRSLSNNVNRARTSKRSEYVAEKCQSFQWNRQIAPGNT